MGKELTEKQEKFVQEYLTNGGNATQAYKSAYNCENMQFDTINNRAYELCKHSGIKARIQAHRQSIKDKFEYTVEDSFKQLDELLKLALCPDGENGKINLQAALKAEELKGKLKGLYIEKVENKHDLGNRLVKIEVITKERE